MGKALRLSSASASRMCSWQLPFTQVWGKAMASASAMVARHCSWQIKPRVRWTNDLQTSRDQKTNQLFRQSDALGSSTSQANSRRRLNTWQCFSMLMILAVLASLCKFAEMENRPILFAISVTKLVQSLAL